MGGLVRAAGPGPAQPGTGIGRTMLLRSALPYMYLHAAQAPMELPPKQEFVVRAGRALAKVAPAVGPGALDVLARAERAPNVEERRVLHIRLSREIVQEALQAKCASLFLRESSVVTQVENLTADVPFGVMLASDADGIHAHKCPNPYSCSLPRHQAMRPATASSSTAPKAGGCPLLLSAPPGGARGATGGAMCASGFYPASPGCTRHCCNFPYRHLVLNAAEAGSLFTLSVGMVLSGLLAGGGWSLTPGFRSSLMVGIAALLILYFLGLVGLWVKVKFFWADDGSEEAFAEDPCDDDHRESNAS